MRVCASSLFSFNGGTSCIQRYVSSLPFCIDVAIMARDDQGISRSTHTMHVESHRIIQANIQSTS